VAYRYYRDPVYLALTSEAWRNDRGTRIFWEDDEIPEAPPLRLASSHLPAMGVTILRAGHDGALALSWGVPQRNDPSRLDFQYYGAGGHLLWSSGITGYASPYYGSWYAQSLSRNGLVVDEGTQAPKAGRLLFLELEGPEQAVAAELVDAYPETRWVRAAVLFPSGEALLLERLTSPRPRTVDWVCQLPGKVETSWELAETDAPWGDQAGYGVLESPRGGEAATELAITLRHRDRGVRILPAAAPGTRLYLAQGRMGTSTVASPVGMLRRKGVTDALYATLLQPFAGEPPRDGRVRIVEKSPTGFRVEIVTAQGTRFVSLREDEGKTHMAFE